jgi:DNA-3-methyladenine glycosylase II
MKQAALDHFYKVDPVLHKVALQVGPLFLTSSNNYFESLSSAIIGQQLSDKVGTVIFERFKNLFPQQNISPELVLQMEGALIKSVGTSNSKVRSLKDLALHVTDGRINLQKLPELSDQEVVATLTQVKGIGPWTAEMFLMFSLGREDIFSAGDLGLLRGIQKLYGIEKELNREELTEFSQKWSPFRTYAARVLWKSLDLGKATAKAPSKNPRRV